MPSKNSINKPKDHMIRSRKATSLRRKKAIRNGKFVTTVRNSRGERSSVTIEAPGGTLANTILSKKKAKKLERNQKYALERSGAKKAKSQVEETREEHERVREALWRIVEEGVMPTAVAVGDGTTLGN